jgi:hypothetical protein
MVLGTNISTTLQRNEKSKKTSYGPFTLPAANSSTLPAPPDRLPQSLSVTSRVPKCLTSQIKMERGLPRTVYVRGHKGLPASEVGLAGAQTRERVANRLIDASI